MALNRAAFFAAVRKTLFGGVLTQDQVDGISAILNAAPTGLALEHLAYCLATVFHETARTMQPIEEYGRGKGRSYGPTGFWGRGFVQLTWEANYAKATARLRELGILKAGEDLMKTPALAMRTDVAAAILFVGMAEGWFTGKRLSDYFGPGRSDPVGARRIINGTDKASMIAGYFVTILAALKASSTGSPQPDPIPSTPTATSPQPASSGLFAALKAGASALHTALSRNSA